MLPKKHQRNDNSCTVYLASKENTATWSSACLFENYFAVKTGSELAFIQMIFSTFESWWGLKQEDWGLEVRWLPRMISFLSVPLFAAKWAVKGVQSSLVRFQSARSSVFSGKGATAEQPIFSSPEGDEQDFPSVTAPSCGSHGKHCGLSGELVCNHTDALSNPRVKTTKTMPIRSCSWANMLSFGILALE